MNRWVRVLLTTLVAFHALTGWAWAGEDAESRPRTALGYCVGLGGLWMFGANLKLGVGPRMAIEATAGVGFDRIAADDSRKFHLAGMDYVWELKKSPGFDLTANLGVWYLQGDTEILELLHFRGERHVCGRVGVGVEAWNGYFMELGYLGSSDVSDVLVRAGYRFYP